MNKLIVFCISFATVVYSATALQCYQCLTKNIEGDPVENTLSDRCTLGTNLSQITDARRCIDGQKCVKKTINFGTLAKIVERNCQIEFEVNLCLYESGLGSSLVGKQTVDIGVACNYCDNEDFCNCSNFMGFSGKAMIFSLASAILVKMFNSC